MCAISRGDLFGLDSIRGFVFFFVFLPTVPKFEAEGWLFLISSAVSEGKLAVTRPHEFCFSPAAISAESPLGGRLCSNLRAPHRGTFLGPFVCDSNESAILLAGYYQVT
jgi:hypothetical protein